MSQRCADEEDAADGNAGGGVGMTESLDVNQVREELEAVEKQRDKSDKSRLSVDKQLSDAVNNATKIQQVPSFSLSLCFSRWTWISRFYWS